MVKYFFCDVETTGFDPKKNGILEIGGIIEYEGTYEEFVFKCQPHLKDEIAQEALDVNKITTEEIKTFPTAKETYTKLIRLLDKHINKYDRTDKFQFVAYNAPFDSNFIREFFKKSGNNFYGSYFFHPYIDVMTITALRLRKERPSMPSFHLKDAAKKIGLDVEEEKLHGAMYDILLTREVYYNNLAFFV